jgi:hypothetical protein
MRLRIAVLMACSAALASAEVVDSSAGGFTVKTTLHIQSAPEEVYRKLVHNIGDWWNSAHTFSQDAHNLKIEEKPGGCLCEKLPNNGFVRHLEVINLMPGKGMVLSGAMGPFQSMAATGTMVITFAPADAGSKMTVSYAVSGYSPKGLNTMAGMADAMIAEQFTRLKNYVETGNAASK